MSTPTSSSTTTEQAAQPASIAIRYQNGSGLPALNSTALDRVQSMTQLENIHPGNRFRLMYGQSLLPDSQKR